MSLDTILSQLEYEQLIRPIAEADVDYIFKSVAESRAIVQFIVERLRDENLCAAFLNLPDVRAVLE